MDVPLWTVVLGFAGTVIAAGLGVVGVIITSRSEKRDAIHTAMEALYNERLKLRDEKIADRDEQIVELKQTVETLLEQVERLSGNTP